MGLKYLCSRTEFLRALYFDTGRRALMVGAPKGFIDWIGKVIPAGSLTVSRLDATWPDLVGGTIPIVLLWLEGMNDVEGLLSSILPRLPSSTDLWVVVERRGSAMSALRPYSSDWDMSLRYRLELTTDSDLVPLVLRGKV